MASNRNCSICGKPIVLFPSAAERARKSGDTAAYYNGLFTSHPHCQIETYRKKTSELIQSMIQSKESKNVRE